MGITLRLLDEVRWRDTPVPGTRPQALLAALAAHSGRSVRAEALIEEIWRDEVPVNATKSLQVLVSRTRSACGAEVIVRDGAGYRLGVASAEVDVLRLSTLVHDAAAMLAEDAAGAAALAREALAASEGPQAPSEEDAGPLQELRRRAAADLASAGVILGQACSRMGAHAEALAWLEPAQGDRPEDESLLADLLRSEAVLRGPATALDRFEHYRRELRERLGVSPGDELQRVQRELLALDQPVRAGVRYDASPLLGREDDLRRLRALLAGARVVSIIGAGGLGKTRLAHVLARDAVSPVVHVVELVGVTAPEDVVGEIGSALGVRDSVTGRNTLTAKQRADVRARIAQRLGQAPSLLVLDNCEHVVTAVAELVAFLVSTTPGLRVLTTSRAPLAIAAERVYLLGELEAQDGARLFCERASAARPNVHLPDEAVHSIVARLDGLPLAIELAAAKVRAMAVPEIDRRLENRFALLRGGDRSAPDRHQTLLAVIDWSWNLLDDGERRALRRLALFHDGFTLEAAREVLGESALEAVPGLVDQSLLSVREADRAGVRYRMLETVREFGRMQLVDAGEDAEARARQRRWALAYARRHAPKLASSEQFAAIDAVSAEEVNLADELRAAIADSDAATLVQLLATLGMFWAIRGEHARLIVLAEAVAEAVRDWRPPSGLEDETRAAMAIMLGNSMISGPERTGPIRAVLERLESVPCADPRLAGWVKAMTLVNPGDMDSVASSLERLAEDPDRHTALPASQWLSYVLENSGDADGAIAAAERALELVREDDGPWNAAILHTQLAQLKTPRGDGEASEHARAALPVMSRLGAADDEVMLRALLGLSAIAQGRLVEAEQELAEIDHIAEVDAVFGGLAVRWIARAELALAQGERATGLRLYLRCAAEMRDLRLGGIPRTGLEPWVLFGEATALTAHAYFARDSEATHGRERFDACRELASRALDSTNPHLDYPALGMVLFALGAWGLLREASPAAEAVRLLALAHRFAYNRMVPTMAWERIASHAEQAAPGQIATLSGRYRPCTPSSLLEEAQRAVQAVRPSLAARS